MMRVIGMLIAQTGMALYCTILLKVYLDVFLVQRGGLGSVAGWLFFFIWQFCVNLKMIFFSPFINLGVLLLSVLVIGFGAYEGGYWKRCIFPIAFISFWMMFEGTVELAYIFVVGTEPSFVVLSVLPKAILFPYVMGIKGLMHKCG